MLEALHRRQYSMIFLKLVSRTFAVDELSCFTLARSPGVRSGARFPPLTFDPFTWPPRVSIPQPGSFEIRLQYNYYVTNIKSIQHTIFQVRVRANLSSLGTKGDLLTPFPSSPKYSGPLYPLYYNSYRLTPLNC